MGKINKNILKTKFLCGKSQKTKPTTKPKIKNDCSNELTKDKCKLLLDKSITPKKTISKKEKYRQKHKNLMNKFTLIKKQQKEERSRKNREKTAIIGDLKPLKDALPSLAEIYTLSKEKDQLKTGIETMDAQVEEKHLSTKQKIKKKKERFINKVKSFEIILKDPEFKKNPREAIRYHIQYTHGLIEE